MAKDIVLYDHNEKACEALTSSLETNPLAFIEHATGTGKSFILLKYLYNNMRDKRILFVTRHYEMLEQLFNDQMSSLGLSKDDFKKFDTMIYPNILDVDMNEVIKNYDCIVWDEAHHCGAPKWSVKVQEAKELVKKTSGKVMIGATATRIRYLDDYMDVAEEYFDGNVISVLPVTRAILKNLLPAPMIIMTSQACLEQIAKIQKKLRKIPQVPAIIEYEKEIDEISNELSDELYVGNALKNYGVKTGEKYIVFCSDINDLNAKMKEASKWFEGIGPVKMFCAHSAQQRKKNLDNISEFSEKRDEVSLMFAVDIFNEGFHIDGVDGILTFRKTKSPIVYWQQLGRALSFSARKKQIKIFDFANNTSDNKVVYDLYKEMIEEARRLIIEDPNNKKLYEEVLSNFQIVDQTTSLLDRLREIDTKIDQEFIISSRVDLAIYKLEEYRNFYPDTNFNEELTNKRISFEYVRPYNYLCDVEDYLTTEQVLRLQKLNISFTDKIDLPSSSRLKLLGKNKTFKEMEENQYNEFCDEYVNFCLTNLRRPEPNAENDLYMKYRYYLISMNKSKLNRLFASLPFRNTLEETIILGLYPSSNDIEDYLNMIREKITKGISLDNIEIKVLKRLSHAIPSEYSDVLNILKSYTDASCQIDQAINIIRNYKSSNNILLASDYKRALKTINQHALKVTNNQFKQLLELGVRLPSKINMTMERRLQELNGYDSFYEKHLDENIGTVNSYIKFVKENRRRPSEEDHRESLIKHGYEKQMYGTTSKKMIEVTSSLIDAGIPLTFEESILSRREVNEDVIKSYIEKIHNKLLRGDTVNSDELKILRIIEKHKYTRDIDISNLIKMIVNINMIDKILLNYQSDRANELQKNNMIRTIFSKARFLTRNQVEKLRLLNIDIPKEIIDSFNEHPEFINYFESEVSLQEDFWNEFMNYIRKNNSYPADDEILMERYRYYLSYAPQNVIDRILGKIKDLGLNLSIEERILIGESSREEMIQYLEGIKLRLESGKELDPFESRVCKKLDRYDMPKTYGPIINPAIIAATNDLEANIVRNLKSCIRLNPFAHIDLENNYSLSKQNCKRIADYRVNLLGQRLLPEILHKLKKSKKPLLKVIDGDMLSFYDELYQSHSLDANNTFLMNEIRSLNRDYILRENGYALESFINEYIDFIKVNKRKPNSLSEDENECRIAITFDEVHDLLEAKDLLRIEKALKNSLEESDIEDFYPTFISFINEIGRFPCGNSDNPEEVHLNELYQNLGAMFTKEQNKEIAKLRKQYGRATLKANIEFAKRKGPKK